MSKARRRQLTAAAGVALVTVACRRIVSRYPPGGAAPWRRNNYRGREVALTGGPVAAAGLATAGLLVAPSSPGLLLGCTSAAGLGLYDDLAGHTHARGLRGHVAALRAGRVTSGLIKLVGLVVTSVAVSRADRRSVAKLPLDVVLFAGTANLVNLLDLRPGRALKVVAATALPLAARPDQVGVAAAGVVGVAAALAPDDLAERAMLGDCGANALGAAVGWLVSRRLPSAGRVIASSVVVSLTLASERISFSRVIDETPVLAAVDALGRRSA